MDLRRLFAGKRPFAPTRPDAPLPDPRWRPIWWPDYETFVPPRELWVGPGDPVVHFFRWCWEYRSYLVLLCGLRRTSSVLEIGCNHGRTMLGLIEYLREPGRYEGFDIVRPQIEWARENIEARVPAFRFTLADVWNGLYNPSGRYSDAEFIFPYPSDHFDVAYAASVFTHLLPAGSANYLREVRRVLRPGGKALFSFFVSDHYAGRESVTCELYQLDYDLPGEPGVKIMDPKRPEQVIGYSRARIEELAAGAGLEVERILPGYWVQTEDRPLNEQDLVLLRRP